MVLPSAGGSEELRTVSGLSVSSRSQLSHDAWSCPATLSYQYCGCEMLQLYYTSTLDRCMSSNDRMTSETMIKIVSCQNSESLSIYLLEY